MNDIPDSLQPGEPWPNGHVGYVALLGRPNTGKSTLLNSLLEIHLAPVSSKPQTTRRNLLGVYSDADLQLIFLDAPGVHLSRDLLDDAMERAVQQAIDNADVVLCMADATRAPGQEDALVASQAQKAGKPVILAINKCDVASPEQIEGMTQFYHGTLENVPTYRTAAVDRSSLDPVICELRNNVPTGPFLFDPDDLTNAIERELGAELIREALLENLHQEIPHAMAVTIDSWEDRGDRSNIAATLHVEREQQKAIVIGKNGTMIKRLKRDAIKKLVELCDRRVKLQLWVKVAPGWRKKQKHLRDFNFLQQ